MLTNRLKQITWDMDIFCTCIRVEKLCKSSKIKKDLLETNAYVNINGNLTIQIFWYIWRIYEVTIVTHRSTNSVLVIRNKNPVYKGGTGKCECFKETTAIFSHILNGVWRLRNWGQTLRLYASMSSSVSPQAINCVAWGNNLYCS